MSHNQNVVIFDRYFFGMFHCYSQRWRIYLLSINVIHSCGRERKLLVCEYICSLSCSERKKVISIQKTDKVKSGRSFSRFDYSSLSCLFFFLWSMRGVNSWSKRRFSIFPFHVKTLVPKLNNNKMKRKIQPEASDVE